MPSVNVANRCRKLRWATPILLILIFTLCACSGVNTRTADGRPIRMTREEFAEYVETTFRYHNRIVNELITTFVMSSDEIPFDPALIRAEEQMAASCRPLNEIVSATIERREPSLWTKLQLLNQVPVCAAATQRVEGLIPTIF